MNFIFFLMRLLALPLILAFFLAGGLLYVVFLGLAWTLLGDSIRVWVTFPDWKP